MLHASLCACGCEGGVREHTLQQNICAHACVVCEGIWVCMFVSLMVMIDDCAICVSLVKLFDTIICLQPGPVVL